MPSIPLLRAMTLAALLIPFTRIIAQTHAVVPSSVSTDVGQAAALTGIENISLGITALTDSNVTFPYNAQGLPFQPGLGYIALYDDSIGTLTFHYAAPVIVTHLFVWNAYSTDEFDHSFRTANISFYDQTNTLIATREVTALIATLDDETASAIELGGPIEGVVRITVFISSLYGGNDISIRRLAFAGSLADGIPEQNTVGWVGSYPCPAGDRTWLPARSVRDMRLMATDGRVIPILAVCAGEGTDLELTNVPSGLYTARWNEGRVMKGARLVVVH